MRDRPGSRYDIDVVTAEELGLELEKFQSPEEKAQRLFEALSDAAPDPADWEPLGTNSYGYNPYYHAVGSVFEAAARDRDTAAKLAELLAQDAEHPTGFLTTATPEVLEIAFIRTWNVGDAMMRPDSTPSLETFARLIGPHLPIEKLTEILQNRLTETSYRTASITSPPKPGTRLTATLIERAAEEMKVLNLHAVKRAFSSDPALLAMLENADCRAKEHAYAENLRSSYPELIKPFKSANQYSQWLKTIDALMLRELPIDLEETARADDAGHAIAYLVSGFSEPELLQEAEHRIETFLEALEASDSEGISDHAKKKAETVITGLCDKIPADTDEGQQRFDRIEALAQHIYPERSLDNRWYSLRRWRNRREAHLENVRVLTELGVDPNLPQSIAHIEIALPTGHITYEDSDSATSQSNLKIDLAVYLDSLAYRGHQTSSEIERNLSKLTRDSDIYAAIDQLDTWLERSDEEPFILPFGSGNKALQYTSYRTITVSRTDQNTFELRTERHERPTQNPADELEIFATKTNRQVDYDRLPELCVRIRPELEMFNRSHIDLDFPIRTSLPLDFLSKVYQKLARLPEGDIPSGSFQNAQEMASSVNNLALTRDHLILEVPRTTSSVAEDPGSYRYQHAFQEEGRKHTLYLPLVTVRHKEEIPLTQAEINQAQTRFKDYIRLSRGTIKTVPMWYTTPKAASITSTYFI